MSAILADTREPALVRAMLANLSELNRALVRSAHGEGFERNGLLRFRTIVPHALYNGIQCGAAPGPDAASDVAATLAHFRARGPRSILWWFDPDVDAAAWRPVLAAHGFTPGSEIPGMAAELASLVAPAAPHVEVRRVVSRADRELWARTFVRGYGFPLEWAPLFADLFGGMESAAGDYRGYLACADGEAVGTASLFLAAGVAGLYDVAVPPEARRRGAGTAVTFAAYAAAAAEGFRIGILHASPLGRPMYERMGFRVVGPVEHFAWKEATP